MANKWIVGATVLWMAAHVVGFIVRFGQLPPDPMQVILFAPTAVIGAWLVCLLVERSSSRDQVTWTLLGAGLMLPLAFLGNIAGGLLGPIGVTLYGLVPLVAGAFGGRILSHMFRA
jgi:hypothetical protein